MVKVSINNKILIYIFLGGFVLANFFLLYSNVKLKEDLHSVKKAQIQNYPILNYDLSSTISITNEEVILGDKGLFLSIFIPENSCISCLDFEIPNINKIYKNYPGVVRIYLVGADKILKDFNTDFKYRVLSYDDSLFDEEIIFSNPLAVLSDGEGKIYDFYLAEINKPSKSYNYYQRMNSFLEVMHRENY